MTGAALGSWKDSPAKQAIVDFVISTTQQGPGFVTVTDRIATFDNNGTYGWSSHCHRSSISCSAYVEPVAITARLKK
jgi:hypothetical protein